MASPSHSNLVPSYPYNVHQPVYSSHGAAVMAPDDSEISTNLPKICVDYLSHNWTEEDIWASWKTMTKTKTEITNGMRLENASWRTWAKQRNKLKTISPETLNWLKDSDVTWLYGPLHTAGEEPSLGIHKLQEEHELEKRQKEAEQAKSKRDHSPNEPASAPLRRGASSSNISQLGNVSFTQPYAKSDDVGADTSSMTSPASSKVSSSRKSSKKKKKTSSKFDKKSILKRRSLTDILLSHEMELMRDSQFGIEDSSHHHTLYRPIPSASSSHLPRYADEEEADDNDSDSDSSHSVLNKAVSDSNLARMGSTSNLAGSGGLFSQSNVNQGGSSAQTKLSRTGSTSSGRKTASGKPAKHISFNRNVEQCIAVDNHDNVMDTDSGSDEDDSDEDSDSSSNASSSSSEVVSPSHTPSTATLSSRYNFEEQMPGSDDNDSDNDIITFGSRQRHAAHFLSASSSKSSASSSSSQKRAKHKLIAPLHSTSLKSIDLSAWPSSSADEFSAPVVSPTKKSPYIAGPESSLNASSDASVSSDDSSDSVCSSPIDQSVSENTSSSQVDGVRASSTSSSNTVQHQHGFDLDLNDSQSTTAHHTSTSPSQASNLANSLASNAVESHGKDSTSSSQRGRSTHRSISPPDRSQPHHRSVHSSRPQEKSPSPSDSESYSPPQSQGDSTSSQQDDSLVGRTRDAAGNVWNTVSKSLW